MTLTDYVKRYYFNNFVEFAKEVKVTRSVVQQWQKSGAYVVDHVMFNPYRQLPIPATLRDGLIEMNQNRSGDLIIVSVAHTQRKNPYIMLWGANNSGYRGRIETAGRYKQQGVMKHLAYYNNGENTIAVPADVAVSLAVPVEPNYFDDNNGNWIRNTRENWRELLDNVICEPIRRAWPDFPGAVRKKEETHA